MRFKRIDFTDLNELNRKKIVVARERRYRFGQTRNVNKFGPRFYIYGGSVYSSSIINNIVHLSRGNVFRLHNKTILENCTRWATVITVEVKHFTDTTRNVQPRNGKQR